MRTRIHKQSLQEGLWITEEMHQTSHSLAHSASQLALAQGSFFAMLSHILILYKQTPNLHAYLRIYA